MFKNTHNSMIKDEDGKVHWISRSVIACCLIVWRSKFLIVRRGSAVTQTGKWCLPCGYLDWDESIEECAVREIHEESGLDIRNYIDFKNLKHDYIVTEPIGKKQAIAFNFIINIDSEKEPFFNMDVIDRMETTDVKWMSISEISNYRFAFDHDKKILKYVK